MNNDNNVLKLMNEVSEKLWDLHDYLAKEMLNCINDEETDFAKVDFETKRGLIFKDIICENTYDKYRKVGNEVFEIIDFCDSVAKEKSYKEKFYEE